MATLTQIVIRRQCLTGSLIGAVALKVTEAPKGSQNGWKSFAECKGIWFDCRATTEQGRKSGLVIRWFRMKGHRSTDKSYPGITGLSPKSSHRRGGLFRCRLKHPGAVVGPKGCCSPTAARASWVQNVGRQFGPYPSRA